MRASLRETVRARFAFRCGYCGTTEEQAGAQLTIDHFQPRSQGGENDVENLVYCCHACNEFKGNYWSESPDAQLLHPLNATASDFYVEQIDNVLIPLNERGRLHIAVLQLNRAALIAARRRRFRETQADALHNTLLQRLDSMEGELRQLSAHLSRLTSGIAVTDPNGASEES